MKRSLYADGCSIGDTAPWMHLPLTGPLKVLLLLDVLNSNEVWEESPRDRETNIDSMSIDEGTWRREVSIVDKT
jgi:hypothetical protein